MQHARSSTGLYTLLGELLLNKYVDIWQKRTRKYPAPGVRDRRVTDGGGDRQ